MESQQALLDGQLNVRGRHLLARSGDVVEIPAGLVQVELARLGQQLVGVLQVGDVVHRGQ